MAIHPTAIIDPSSVIHESAEIGPNVVIGAGCEVGAECVLMHGCVLGPRVRMGARNVVHYHAVVGHDPQYLGFDPSTKSGVLIGDGNHFREMCSIHRGLKDGKDTVIGSECFIMANSHVAHDCKLGDKVVLVNGSLLAGHVEVGDRAFISGLVGVHQFCRIGAMAMISGQTGIPKDVPPFMTARGMIACITGVNAVGLRRAGISAETRLAIKRAFKTIFRSGSPLGESLARIKAEWEGKPMPGELAQFIEFCEQKSPRGLLGGRLHAGFHESFIDDEEDDD